MRTVIAPKRVPLAAIPGVASAAMSARPGASATRSSAKSSAAVGITSSSTAIRNASTPAALPAKSDARGRGDTSRPISADSSRSRCHVRPMASTDANVTLSQMTPGATDVFPSPTVNATDESTATRIAKNPAVVTTSPVFSSRRRSFSNTSMACETNPGRARVRASSPVGVVGVVGVVGRLVTFLARSRGGG